MTADFWHKQEQGKPLFPKLEWSQPENRHLSGKLLLIGGNLHGFAAPAEAYAESIKAGIGTTRVLLPSAIQKVVGPHIENGEFAPSTPSGSFAQAALGELIEGSKWADGVLFAGDLGRNSETAILVEKFLQKHEAMTVLTNDSIDYIIASPLSVLERPNTALVLTLPQLQRLAVAANYERPVASTMDLMHLVDWLHGFTDRYALYLTVKHAGYILVGVKGEVSSTKLIADTSTWQLETATYGVVWWIQNRSRPFEGITAGVYSLYCHPSAITQL